MEKSGPGTVDPAKLEQFLNKVVGDFGAALSMGLAYIGDRLGIYRARAQHGPMTSEVLAGRTGLDERYLREWLLNQAAGGYCDYDPISGTYSLGPEQVVALTQEDSPAFVAGGFSVIKAMVAAVPRIQARFVSGEGLPWCEHDPDLFTGTERFFRPGYARFLIGEWIPALEGMPERLARGARVADVGCGLGASTRLMAHAYPSSRFFGFDNHSPSIEKARAAAAAEGLSDRIEFQVVTASEFPGESYALIAFFDCLHDMQDPVSAIRHAAGALEPEGSVMIVEPMAGEKPEENFNAVGRTFSAASTLCCTANGKLEGGAALGAVASESRLREIVRAGGLERFERVATTPFNRVFQARR